ncbi:hypothetical protein P3875_03650 [Myroides sp. JBRI-B21084]|uniref:hypothetical protein n=1 Tax=Myroides sp. JBRI-B21084 TaxID=3119977 RepID=UPI0026E3ADB5|nr:hypothetical protein [Paenimyroides cloacae]WKW47165.1 hypothetical protein P3875_03650 [Paenimyroides cloacae]
MKNLLLLFALLLTQITFAQSQQNDFAFTAKAAAVPVFNTNRLGVEVGLSYYLTNRFSVGTHYLYTNNKFTHGFGYPTNNAIVHFLAINVPLQYDFVNEGNFQIGMGIVPGLILSTLRDKNQLKEEEHYNEETGVTTVIKTPIRLNRDAYFALTPNVDAKLKVATIEAQSHTQLYVTGNAGYQFVFGSGDFTKPTNFRNYTVSIGFAIKGALE